MRVSLYYKSSKFKIKPNILAESDQAHIIWVLHDFTKFSAIHVLAVKYDESAELLDSK
jgi:hypothetical protein